ncbi:MAG: YicC family protein [Magnetospirillum sp.]|nr:YicC family protein [Magnetospirillum sp.]
MKEVVLTVASMTGYARAEGCDAQVSWLWEAKSVNGRGLDVRLRLPPGHDGLEPLAREAAARHLKRGNVQLSLTVTRTGEAPAVRLNTPLLEQILTVCREWERKHPNIAPARWDGLLAVKGVLEPAEAEEADAEAVRHGRETAMKASLDDALAALVSMRRSEGARLAAVLGAQLDEMGALAKRAEAAAVLRPEAVRERMRAQVAALLDAAPALPEERIAQELAVMAVKGDVREELDRLAAHIDAARELLQAGGAVGRKLDFLSQEFNREANTLCSKSADVELTRVGLDLKAVIDQFREQVQNIE